MASLDRSWHHNGRPHRRLRRGHRGEDVRRFQQGLNARLARVPAHLRRLTRRSITVDGVFDDETLAAWREVRWAIGLPAKHPPTVAAQLNVRAPHTRTPAAVLRAKQRRRLRLNETVAFDGTPVFRGHALMLEDARRHGWQGTLTSADRRKGVAERYGKLSQAALYAAWLARLPWANPANPPGRSTHELRSDAVAYPGPVGRPLAWWQLGLDCTDAPRLRTVLVGLGYDAFRPYADGREAHHVNLRSSPKPVLQRRGLA